MGARRDEEGEEEGRTSCNPRVGVTVASRMDSLSLWLLAVVFCRADAPT